MRFLITAAPAEGAKAPAADAIPSDELIAAYMKFNEDMHKAGVLLAAEGLSPESRAVRVVARGGKRTVVDGPFTETKELLGGFYLIEVASKEEAIRWALRCPSGIGHDDVLTIHQMTSLDELPPEVLALIRKAAPTWSAAVERPR